MNLKKTKALLTFSINAGLVMLENGGETYRVEETIDKICASRGANIESFVTPTGIFLSATINGKVSTYIKRVRSISIDLYKVEYINDLSRNFSNRNISLKEAIKRLAQIDEMENYNEFTKYLNIAAFGFVFALLFGGKYIDAISAGFVSIAVRYSIRFLTKYEMNYFIKNILGGFISTILANIITSLNIGTTADYIVIGTIMQLVPGVAITNSIRDVISGDFLSGMSRTAEALSIAIGIAFGVLAGIRVTNYFIINLLGGF